MQGLSLSLRATEVSPRRPSKRQKTQKRKASQFMLLLGVYPLSPPTSALALPPHPGDGLPDGPHCPNTGSGFEWLQGWRVPVAQAAGPPGGQQAPRRGRCCRRLPDDRVRQRYACAQPGVGCSAGATGSATGLHGRCPMGHLAWGQDERECQARLCTQAVRICIPILSVPLTHDFQRPLESGKVPLQLWGVTQLLIIGQPVKRDCLLKALKSTV